MSALVEQNDLHPLDELALIEAGEVQRKRPWALWLLLVPIATVLYPPLYNRHGPVVAGLPFFVWYQLVAVAFGGVVTGIVYLLRGTERKVDE